MSKKIGWVLLVVWAGGMLAALLAYSQRQLSEFDPDGVLLHASTSPNFDSNFVAFLKEQNVEAGSIVHIGTASNCYCNSLTKPHQTQLLNRFESEQYQLTSINIESAAMLKKMLSSVPALVIVDKDYQLRYVGPYATGYGCFTGKDMVDQVVTYTKQAPYQGAVINADAQGCFCQA